MSIRLTTGSRIAETSSKGNQEKWLADGRWYKLDLFGYEGLASGMEQSYIDSYVRYYTSPGWLAFILLFTTLMGFLGCMVGSRLIRRHFQKAGVL